MGRIRKVSSRFDANVVINQLTHKPISGTVAAGAVLGFSVTLTSLGASALWGMAL
jgi:hypothetical protein